MRDRYDKEYEEELYREFDRHRDIYEQNTPVTVKRRRKRRRRRKRSGCLGCGTSCIIPFLLCLALLLGFRDRYPVNLLISFLDNPILSTSDDPLLGITESLNDASSIPEDGASSIPKQEETSDPVEVKQDDSDTSSAETPDASEEKYTGFCYQSMSPEQRLIYEQLYEGIASRKQEFNINAKEAEVVGTVLNGLLADNPGFFWMDGAASIYGLEGRTRKKITLEFNCEPEEIAHQADLIEWEADKYLQGLAPDASDYDKVKAAYEFVINNVSYDIDAPQGQNLQSSMINHLSVCAGYSKELQYLLQKAGVKCAYITGTVTRDDVVESHAWNLVEIDGTNTYVDPTWGDPSYVMSSEAARELPDISYNYLCLTSDEMDRTGHVANENYVLPECTSYEYDYYIRSGRYYEYCDTEAIRMQLRNAVDNNVPDVHMKFATLEDYFSAQSVIFDEGMLSEELQNRMKWDGLTTITYFPLTNDDLYTIEILW